MPTNDPILLEQLLEQRKTALDPEASDSDFFELFVAEELLKDYSLSYEELDSGLIGGGNDGGIDGFWIFANGDLIREDSDLTRFGRNVDLELVIVQAKRSPGFSEDPINRLMAVTENLLDLSTNLDEFQSRYNSELLESVKIFREVYRTLATNFPFLRIRYVYATEGADIHDNARAKARDLEAKIPALFSSAETSFEFVGAADLISLARRQPRRSFSLVLAESPISATGAVAYVCLVRLSDLFTFVTDDDDNIREELFEANVRDYQGKTEVNKEIQESLQQPGLEDFWWLNNGITVLAAKATQSGKTLAIEDPQIVNGLQTCRQIFQFFIANPETEDDRLVLIRVIVPDASESRDKIIKATNSQTYIPPASLKATDKIQRDIEEFIRGHGLYYDRRKNFYKNDGKPVADIVGIPKMAQALMAIILAQPDTARARPSSLIKNDTDYNHLFSTSHPIEVYLACIQILRRAEQHLRSMDDLEPKDRNNLRFYIALELARDMTNEVIPSLSALKEVIGRDIPDEDVRIATDRVVTKYRELGGTDQVAKGTELKSALAR